MESVIAFLMSLGTVAMLIAMIVAIGFFLYLGFFDGGG